VLDRFGRPITSLRISVTSDCNLNCFYCHREGCPAVDQQLGPAEIKKIVEVAREFGVRKVKFTGGEPLLRDDIVDIVASVADQELDDVSLVTNGILLADVAQELAEVGLNRVNISLDTLDSVLFAKITGEDLIGRVLTGISAAVDAELTPVKINMVLLTGVNDGEIDRMIKYAFDSGAVLQIIELLCTQDNEDIFARYHRGLEDVEQKLSERALRIEARRLMHNRKKFFLPEGEVETVKPMDNTEFCMHCTRLRLTADGHLKPCLLRNDNLVDVLSPLRSGSLDGVRVAFEEAIQRREPYFDGKKVGCRHDV
jgi:cyclic pyranopterin phosphate synthase